jgi:coproporphyrinogen III oxidase|tara:strand:+ start:12473 stop:13378 length:906 start_codon:yes stop_codon:yes gene_type:complete
MKMKNKFSVYIDSLQERITSDLEKLDGKSKFIKDNWEREKGGGGLTMILENGDVFEKAGVNVSKVYGNLPESMSKLLKVNQSHFFACGISLVLHPKNPMAPTFHANLRYFELYEHNVLKDRWFGGGLDLTPYYIFEEDIVHFHKSCKKVCDSYNESFYSKYKRKCDEYFWNSHRNEARGVGGLFFDYCRESNEMNIDNWFSFISDLGNSFLKSYVPIIKKRKDLDYNNSHEKWQQIRRGRYVEFNLLHDKGTLFGLKTNGRIESILISMPPKAQWVYDQTPSKGSEEEKLLNILKSPKKWT